MDPQAIFDNFRSTIRDHYFDMNGRVGRAQFWYFVLANFVGAILAAILQGVTFLPLLAIYNLAMLFPAAGMGARRLQDTGRDGKLVWIFIFAAFISQLMAAISMLGAISMGFMGLMFFGPALALVGLVNLAVLVVTLVLIYFWCQPGDPGANAYGPPPPVFDPSRPVSPPA